MICLFIFKNQHQNQKNAVPALLLLVELLRIDLYAEMRKSAFVVVLDISFGSTNFQKSKLFSAQTIAEYLERNVALGNEIPPIWQISPRLSSIYVCVMDVLLPTLLQRSLVAEDIASCRVLEQDEDDGHGKQGGKKKERSRADLLGVLVEVLDDNGMQSILFDAVICRE